MEYSRFKELRQQRGYNQGALGDELRITGDYVNMIENGRRTPSFALAKRMADFFGVTVDELFFCPITNNLFINNEHNDRYSDGIDEEVVVYPRQSIFIGVGTEGTDFYYMS